MEHVSSMKDTVSVVIPTYNRAVFLGRVSLPSIVAQTCPALEVIVVDDGSTDDTKVVVEEFARRHPAFPLVYMYQKNAGVAAARNAGIGRAKGEWIMTLDSDDALLPDALAVLMDAGARASGDLVAGRTWRVSWGTGRIRGIGGSTPSSVILKKTVFTKHGLYDEDRNIIEDLDHSYRLWPLIHAGTLVFPQLSYPTSVYFSHDDQVTSLANPGKLAVRAAAMIKKWESIMPDTTEGHANMARLWRNRGVYEILSGDRASGKDSLLRSLRIKRSAETAILYASARVGGKGFFTRGALPFKHMSEGVSFKIKFIMFFIREPALAERLIKQVHGVVRAGRKPTE